MNKLANFIVKRKLPLLIIFGVLLAVSICCAPFVKINYDASRYLPADSQTHRALEVMREEFGDNGDMAVMAKDIDIRGGIELKKKIAAVSGVRTAMWLDDLLLNFKRLLPGVSDETFLNIVINAIEKDPTIIPEEYRAQFEALYKDRCCLITVVMEKSAYDTATIEAVKQISALGDVYMTGQSATAYSTINGIVNETLKALLILLPILIALLILGTSSFFEPVILIGVIGVSVLINMGSNIFLGDISYLTQSVAAILQLALSMDYSIFLMKKYRRERDNGVEKEAAMITAVKRSLSPVSASSLTTVAGFVALMFMRYTIGLDMGIVLAKGILISLVTVFLLMPALVIYSDKLLIKTRHRSLPRLLKDAGKARTLKQAAAAEKKTARANVKPAAAAAPEAETESVRPGDAAGRQPYRAFTTGLKKTRFILPVIALALVIPCYFFQRDNSFMYGEFACTGAPGTRLYEDRAAVTDVFGNQNNTVVLVPVSLEDREKALTEALTAAEYVTGVQSYSLSAALIGDDPALAEALRAQFFGKNYYRIIVNLNTGEEGDEAFAAVEALQTTALEVAGEGCLVMGSSAAALNIKDVVTVDFNLVNLLTLIFIGIILLVTFRSLLIPLILLAAIQSSIWLNMAIPYLFGEPMVFIGYLIVSCIQMGATIDYGILMTNNYLTARQKYPKFDAVYHAVGQSAGPIALSSSILCVAGFVVGLSSTLPSTSVMGLAIGRGALTSFVLMLVVVPQLLMLLDKPIRRTMLGGRKLVP